MLEAILGLSLLLFERLLCCLVVARPSTAPQFLHWSRGSCSHTTLIPSHYGPDGIRTPQFLVSRHSKSRGVLG
jgi:hypothetical protein